MNLQIQLFQVLKFRFLGCVSPSLGTETPLRHLRVLDATRARPPPVPSYVAKYVANYVGAHLFKLHFHPLTLNIKISSFVHRQSRVPEDFLQSQISKMLSHILVK